MDEMEFIGEHTDLSQGLADLKSLTERILLEDLLDTPDPKGVIDYPVIVGKCLGYPLAKSEAMAVQKAYMASGTIFPSHSHREKEVLGIFKGKVLLLPENQVYGIGGVIIIEPGQMHEVHALEDTWVVAFTIPASSAYPE